MNYIKAQKEIFAALCSRNNVARFNVDENNILVTPDGFRAYIFPASTIVFNLDKIREIKAFPVGELIKPENELKLTPDLRIVDNYGRRMVRRLKGNGKNVYINPKFLDCFQNPKFYQEGASSLTTIVVTEKIGMSKFPEVPVGIILPIRATWDDGSYYGDGKDVTA